MICALASVTKQIRMGPAIRRLALYHPLQVAIEAAVCDQLTGGRYMFGFGRGGPVSGWGQRGTDWEKTHDMMIEGIDLITRIFHEKEPFDFEGKFYRGTQINVYPKPIQKPHPPIAVATGNPILIDMAVDRDFSLLTSQFARPSEIRKLAQLYAQAAQRKGRTASTDAISAVRGIYIAESEEQAVREVAHDWTAHLEYNKTHFPVNFKNWTQPGRDVSAVDFDHLRHEGLMFVGSPESVTEEIETFIEESGGFGTLLLVTGRDWGTLEQRKRSLRLFAEEVAPRFAGQHGMPGAGLPGQAQVRSGRAENRVRVSDGAA